MKRTAVLAFGVALLASTSVFAQSPPDVSDMINQLVPADAKTAPTLTGESVLTVQGASKDEIVRRLGASATRSIGTQPGAPLPSFTKGREVEVLRALNGRPSVQVAVAFQGASDALAPESGALLGALGQALSDPKVASSRILIGVHTNSVGSDEYNLDLSQLRAKAIADTLALVYGVAHDRLIPFGFGRAVENGTQNATADERIQVVNLGSVAVASVPDRPVVAPPSVASAPSRPHLERPTVQRPVFVQKPVIQKQVAHLQVEPIPHVQAEPTPHARIRDHHRETRVTALPPRDFPPPHRRFRVHNYGNEPVWGNEPVYSNERAPYAGPQTAETMPAPVYNFEVHHGGGGGGGGGG